MTQGLIFSNKDSYFPISLINITQHYNFQAPKHYMKYFQAKYFMFSHCVPIDYI